MTFIAVSFDYGATNTTYARLMKVFKKSVEVNCPGAVVKDIYIEAPRNITYKRGFASNTAKLAKWLEAMYEIEDEHLIFIDCDMMVLKEIKDIFNQDFDIACTKRSNSPYKYNGGVVFAKNNERSKAFMKLWLDINNKMLNDFKFHSPWRDKYAGMNQAAFGYIMEKCKYDAKLIEVPCSIWNLCNEDWVRYNDSTRIVHIKGQLRKGCLGLCRTPAHIGRLVELWLQYSDEYRPTKKIVKKPTMQNVTVQTPWLRFM